MYNQELLIWLLYKMCLLSLHTIWHNSMQMYCNKLVGIFSKISTNQYCRKGLELSALTNKHSNCMKSCAKPYIKGGGVTFLSLFKVNLKMHTICMYVQKIVKSNSNQKTNIVRLLAIKMFPGKNSTHMAMLDWSIWIILFSF